MLDSIRRSLLGLAFGLVLAHPAMAAETTAPPGGLVRWIGSESVSECGRGNASWAPISGDCWVPIDLLVSASKIEIWRRSTSGRETATIHVADYPYPVQHITLKDDSKVNLSEADGARAARESKAIGALWDLDGPRSFELPLGAPLEDLPAGGRFGSRRFFNDQPRSPHSGSDFAAGSGTTVLSSARGEVVLADDLFFSGKSVFVHHGDGLVTMYFHLSEIDVAVGDRVDRGQRVGAVGATGRATGPHLHFGIRWKGARVDPALLMGSLESVSQVGAR